MPDYEGAGKRPCNKEEIEDCDCGHWLVWKVSGPLVFLELQIAFLIRMISGLAGCAW
jgi:hypothetical protein